MKRIFGLAAIAVMLAGTAAGAWAGEISTTVEATAGGTVYRDGEATWTAARDAVDGDGTLSEVWAGSENTYANYRGALYFNLPAMRTLVSCVLHVYGISDNSTADQVIRLYGGGWDTTLEVGDYDTINGWQASGAYISSPLTNDWNTSSYSAGWNSLTFSASGMSGIHGPSSFFLAGNCDYANVTPTGTSYVRFDNSTHKPYLEITYYPYEAKAPTDLKLRPVAGYTDRLEASWNRGSSTIDNVRLLWVRAVGDTVTLATVASGTNNTTVTGLSPMVKYKCIAVSDSSGYHGYSAPSEMSPGQEFSRVVLPVTTLYGVHAKWTAVYDSARTENLADSLAYNTNDYQYRIGQSTGGDRRVNRLTYSVTLPTLAGVTAPVWACTTLVYLQGDGDSTVTDFTVRMLSSKWSGAGTVVEWFKGFVGWVWAAAYTVTTLMTDYNTSGLAPGDTKWAYNTAGIDSTNAEYARGEPIRRTFLSSRDVSKTAPSGFEWFGVTQYADLILYVALPDTAPGSFALEAISPTSLRATWVDRAHSERGYVLVDGDGIQVADTDTVDANVTTMDVTGLGINTQHTYKIMAVGSNAQGLTSDPFTCYTEAAVPSVTTFDFPDNDQGRVIINAEGNPDSTEMAVQDDVTGKYVNPHTGELQDTPDWNTLVVWGGASGALFLVGVGKLYRMRAKARNGVSGDAE